MTIFADPPLGLNPDCDDPAARPAPGAGDVVVGVDGSKGSQVALEWAFEHASGLGRIVAASSWHRSWWDVSPIALGHDLPEAAVVLEHRARTAAVTALQRLVGSGPPGASTAVVTRPGVASEVLLDLARSASMLVVGSRGRGRAVSALLGSTSARCAQHSSVPVAVVPSGIDPRADIDQIAVGVDGSENSLAALRWALRFAPVGATIQVHFCWMSLPVASSLTASELDRVREASEGFLAAVVDRVIEEERAWHRMIRRHLTVGDPAAALTASGASLVVVGVRSQGSLVSALLHSPANALVEEPSVVTVLVPAETSG